MKKPYLNQEQRQQVIHETWAGAFYKLSIALEKLKRENIRRHGFLIGSVLNWYICRIEIKTWWAPNPYYRNNNPS